MIQHAKDLVSLRTPPNPSGSRKLGCAWKITVFNKDGKITKEVDGENSILTNYAKLLQACLIGDGISITCTDGVAREMGVVQYPYSGAGPYGYGTTNYTRYYDYWGGFIVTALTGDDTHGIVAGTGSTDQTSADYTMAAKIATGEGAGLMVYRDMVVSGVNEVGNQIKQTLTRTLENLSGNTITLAEIGVVVKCHEDVNGTPANYVQIIRDVLDTPLDIEDDSSVVIDYVIYTEL